MMTTEQNDLGAWLSVPEAAQEAGITEAAVRNAIYRKKLQAVEKAGRFLIRRTAFDEYRKTAKVGRPTKTADPAA